MIKARDLSRTFTTRQGTVEAVRGVNVDVGRGEIVGFLGPNGAGKTTTLRMLTTLLRPTGGEAWIAGYNLLTDPGSVRRHIGYVAQGNGAGDDQRVLDELVVQGQLYGLRPPAARERAHDLLTRLDLDGLSERLVSTLSGGQRRRLDFAMGTVHRPELLFLDEPSTGLDPQSRSNLWQHVRSLRTDDGTTVFLTTHYLDEADALCDRILVIDGGRIAAEGTPEELKRRVSGDLVILGTTATEVVAEVVGRLADVTEFTAADSEVRFRVPGGNTVVPVLLSELDQRGVRPNSIEVRRPTLDDVFLTLTGHSLRESADGA